MSNTICAVAKRRKLCYNANNIFAFAHILLAFNDKENFMNKRCCFVGHSKIYVGFENKLRFEIEKLILYKGVNEFWVGNYGVFDRAAAKTVRKLKAVYPNIKLSLVLPYTTKIIEKNKERYYKKFDSLLIADIPEKTTLKRRIIKCNEDMINECDFLICYVRHSWGGASKTLEYATKKKHIKIINIGNS